MYVPGSEACKDAWKERKRSRHGAPIWSPSSHIVSARCRYGWHMRVTWFTHMYATCISSIVTGTVCICPFENRVLGQSSGGSAPWHLVRAGYCRTPDRATAAPQAGYPQHWRQGCDGARVNPRALPHSPHKVIKMRRTLCLSALLFCAQSLAHPHHSHLVDGSLSAGPSEQGTCTRSDSRTDTFSCSNGSTCQWQTDSQAFSCSIRNLLAADSTSPGRACTSHGDHYECDDGSRCEIVDGVWLCEVTEPHSSDSCNGVDLGDYDLNLHIIALL